MTMKIKEIRAMRLEIPHKVEPKTKPRRQSWIVDAEVANPMSKYPRYKRHRRSWLPNWGAVWVKVTAEDGTWEPLQPRMVSPLQQLLMII